MKMKKVINEPPRVEIINVPISAVNMEQAINFVKNNLNNIRGQYICASNAYTTVMAHENKNYNRVQSESILSLPDGKPLSVVGKKKYPSMDKVTGPHFMINIFSDKYFLNCKHYFYGQHESEINDVITKVKEKYPHLNICGYEPSIFRELSDREVNELAQRINDSQADFVWIGIGAPKQEFLMNKLKKKTNSVMVGVGGAFNILSDKINDAPRWMQNIGLEWLYRLLKEPKRLFKRYFVTNSKFLYYLWRNRWKRVEK